MLLCVLQLCTVIRLLAISLHRWTRTRWFRFNRRLMHTFLWVGFFCIFKTTAGFFVWGLGVCLCVCVWKSVQTLLQATGKPAKPEKWPWKWLHLCIVNNSRSVIVWASASQRITCTLTVAAGEEDDQQLQSTSAPARWTINTEICAHQWLFVYRQNALQRLLLTLAVFFVTLFTVYLSSMYSSCDLSTRIYYTNIWIWIN